MASASIMTDLMKEKKEKEVKELVEDFLQMIKESPEMKTKIINENDYAFDEPIEYSCKKGEECLMLPSTATLSLSHSHSVPDTYGLYSHLWHSSRIC